MSIMKAKDAVSGTMGSVFAEIEGTRYQLANIISIEATVEKTKTEVPILGRTGKGHKSTGWEGTGSMTLHYNQSTFRDLINNYRRFNYDTYFMIQVKTYDPSTNVGLEEVWLKDCNIDSVMIANLDADADYLEEDVDFTFDDFEFKSTFITMDASSGGTVNKLTSAGLQISQGLKLAGTATDSAASIIGNIGSIFN